MGKKYIIELEDEPFGRNDDPDYPHGMDLLWRVKGFNSIVFDENGLSKLTPLSKVSVDEGYEWYKSGMDAAWEAARKLEAMTVGTLERIFPDTSDIAFVCNQVTASEAIEALEKFELKTGVIRLFDEVRWDYPEDKPVFIVTRIDKSHGTISGIAFDGQPYMDVLICECSWTGRHYDAFGEYFSQRF